MVHRYEEYKTGETGDSEEAFWGLTYLEGWDDYSDIDISDLMSDSEVFDDYDFGEEDTCGEKMYDSDDDYDEFY